MKQLSEKQQILLNRLMDIIAHDDGLLEQLASELEIDNTELSDLVNTVEF